MGNTEFCGVAYPPSWKTLFTPAATKGARTIPHTPKSFNPAYMAARDRRG